MSGLRRSLALSLPAVFAFLVNVCASSLFGPPREFRNFWPGIAGGVHVIPRTFRELVPRSPRLRAFCTPTTKLELLHKPLSFLSLGSTCSLFAGLNIYRV